MGPIRRLGLVVLTVACISCGGGPGLPPWLTPRGGGPFVTTLGSMRITMPAFRAATDARIARLRVDEGFAIEVFARDLHNARMLAVADDGTVYVTRMRQGDVVMLPDRDRDGRADEVRVVARGLPRVHGIALHDHSVFLATPGEVLTAPVNADGTFGATRVLYRGFPPGGRHPNRTLAFGPDNALYLSTGSTCNVCIETHPEAAAMVRLSADGTRRELFARGLRNTIGFDWDPSTGDLWGMDNGSDERGDETPPEELNRILENRNYGWPFCFADRVLDRRAVNDLHPTTMPDCAETEAPVLTAEPHAAPMAFTFYRGTQFPEPYRHDAFVALHGSWNRDDPSGYRVARVHFANGRPTVIQPFLDGFYDPHEFTQFGRPVGLATAGDGALLVSDDANGMVYRVAWRGGSVAPRPSEAVRRF